MSAYGMQGAGGHHAAASPATCANSTNMTSKLTMNNPSATAMTSTSMAASTHSWAAHPHGTISNVTTRPPMSRVPNTTLVAQHGYSKTAVLQTPQSAQSLQSGNGHHTARTTSNHTTHPHGPTMPTVSSPRYSVPNQDQQEGSHDSLAGHMPSPRDKVQELEGNSPSPSKSPGKEKDFTTQLLQFVGLPANLAGRLAPQQIEQRKRVRQTPLSLHNITKTDVPKPGAPLPANLVDDIKAALPSGPASVPSRSSSTSARLGVGHAYKRSAKKATSPLKPNNISGGILLRTTSSFSSNVKRMSLQDYKSSRDASRTAANEIQSNSSCTQADDDIVKHANVEPQKDAEGFVIPNASINIAPKVNRVSTPVTPPMPLSASIISGNQSASNDIVVTKGTERLDDNSSDELDDELVIDESQFDMKVDNEQSEQITADDHADNQQRMDEKQNLEDEDDDKPYQPKTKKDISELSMELDELYKSLDTDGSLLMDRRMRRKLKKVMRRQRRREERAKRRLEREDDEQDSSDEVEPVDDDGDHHQDQKPESPEKKEEIDYPPETPKIKPSKDAEKSSQEKDSPKFKTLKHKHIIRKYRQRELEEHEKQKKRECEPLSEGEVTSDESVHGEVESDKEAPAKESDDDSSNVELVNTKSKERVSQQLDLDFWESNWIEELPDSPNDLTITFTVQVNTKPSTKIQEVPVGKPLKKTLAERSGSFRGEELGFVVEGQIVGGMKRKKSPRRKGKSPDVIKINDHESFLDGGIPGDDIEVVGQKSSKQKRRKRRISAKQTGRSSKSPSHSPHRDRSRSHSPLKERRRSRHSRSRSRSPGRKRNKSDSRSPRRESRRRYRRSSLSSSRSRSRSPATRKHRSRSYSRSPPRRGKTRYSRNESHRSKSKSRSPKRNRTRSRSRSRTPPSKVDSRMDSKPNPVLVDDDRNLEDLSMDISSGESTPPLAINTDKSNTDKSEDDEVSKKLEEAMEKLKKMEENVSKRQLVLEDLGSKASGDESKAESLPAKSTEKTEEMDQQLIDAIHRLQKMEETYTQRQRLLNSLRQSMLDAENEAGIHDDEEGKESSDEERPIPLPQAKPSSSAAVQQQVPTSKAPKPIPSAKHSNLPSTSQPGPSHQQASRKSRWDVHGNKPIAGNQQLPPPVVKVIPTRSVGLDAQKRPPLNLPSSVHVQRSSALAQRSPVPVQRSPALAQRSPVPAQRSPVPVQRPPVPLQRPPVPVQRPPWDSNRPPVSHHSPHHSGPHPATASHPPGPATTAPSALKPQPKQSTHQIVWLVGSSILCQAARYVAQGPVGLGLMLNTAELVWHGRDDLKWADFGPLLARLMGTSIAPNVLVVHMDALELASTSFQDLAQQAVESLLEFNRRSPNCRIIWSEALPCCNYPGSIAKMTMEQVRINYNVMCGKLVLSLGGQIIKHSAIRPETSALFNEDRMHLSDLGNNVFLNNLRRGLAFLLNEPKTKVYSASDDRNF